MRDEVRERPVGFICSSLIPHPSSLRNGRLPQHCPHTLCPRGIVKPEFPPPVHLFLLLPTDPDVRGPRSIALDRGGQFVLERGCPRGRDGAPERLHRPMEANTMRNLLAL